jgi:hypothetical protein
MASASTGFQVSTQAQQFMPYTTPMYFPTFMSAEGKDSPHLPLPHHAEAPENIGFTDLAPDRNGIDFGQQSYFRYTNNDNDVLKSCTLVLQLAPLTAGANTYNARYVDDAGYRSLERAEFDYGGNEIQPLFGDHLHFSMVQELPHDELTRRYKLQGAGLSDNQRAVAARADQYLYIDLPFFWTKRPDAHWHQYALQRLTRIILYFRNANFLVQATPNPGVTDLSTCAAPTPVGGSFIKSHWLRFEVSTPSLATKEVFRSMVEGMKDVGWNYPFADLQRLRDITIPAGTLNYTYLLSTFTKYGYNLRFIIRPTLNLQPNFLNNNCWQLIDLASFSFEMSGIQYQQPIDDFYHKHAQLGKHYYGNEEIPVYNVLFTEYPDVATHGMGGIEMSNVVNPTLKITFPGATPAPYSMDAFLACHNYARLIVAGGKSAAETIQPVQN